MVTVFLLPLELWKTIALKKLDAETPEFMKSLPNIAERFSRAHEEEFQTFLNRNVSPKCVNVSQDLQSHGQLSMTHRYDRQMKQSHILLQ